MINFNLIRENIKEHNPNWLQILHHPNRILVIRLPETGKTNA